MSNMLRIAFISGSLLLTTGCTSYYKVTDPTTGKVYYTTEMKKKSSGAAELTDARTGNKVSVQNSEVQKIKKKEFEAGKNTAPAPTPAPTPTPAPAK